MIYDISIMAKCGTCEKKMDLEKCEGGIYCNSCFDEDELIDEEFICKGINEVASREYAWNPTIVDVDISFMDDLEKRKVYFQGIKRGYADALFWVCDWFDVIKYYEEHIEQKFNEKKK